MKKRKLVVLTTAITVAAIANLSTCNVVNAKQISESSVVNYDSPEVLNKDGVKITKFENVNTKEIIDENRVLVLKDNGVYSNPNADIAKSYIRVYNLKTTEYTDYKNVNMATSEFHGISPSGRYVLFGEPRIIPSICSEEWEKAAESGELFNEKRDILDLSTGEVIENFDKTLRNYEAQYKWISDDYIFVDYGSSWSILNKEGKTIKEGKLDFTDCNSDYSRLVDVSELKADGNNISGSFYYTKDFMGSDRNLGIGIYSMDVNTKQEKLINKEEYSNNAQKQGDVISEEYFKNNGVCNKNGVYVDRTFCFKLINKDGSLVKDYELPKGKNFDSLTLSPTGEKCAFIEEDSLINNNRSSLNDTLKVLDVKTGEVRKIAKVGDLINKVHEEEFYNYKVGDRVICRTEVGRISNISWDKTGNTLTFNYNYTSKDDGENYTNTYVVTFNK